MGWMNEVLQGIPLSPLIGATSVVSAPLLYHRCRAMFTGQTLSLVGRLSIIMIWLSWFFLLVVGMAMADISHKLLVLLYWIMQVLVLMNIILLTDLLTNRSRI